MPKKPKPAHELTTEEVMQRIFPKPAVEQLKRIAHGDKPDAPKPSS
jgi:hypothetical protein